MGISFIQIKRWHNMLTGKSIEHVHQDIGKYFAKDEVRGYYNNLMQKVSLMPELLESDRLPEIRQLDGTYILFPVAIFQYALGCYDYYISSNDDRYLNKFLQCADWTISKQDNLGRWDNFSHTYPNAPYGAMAQGEAVSVLVRAFIETKDQKYLEASKRAVDFMLLPIENGGTSIYNGEDLLLAEYTHLPVVLNGWIFAWWGLYDFVLASSDNDFYFKKLYQSCKSLMKFLPSFKISYWSKYDLGYMIASPFYHNLHISQMQAMFHLTGEPIFENYAKTWERQFNNPINKGMAFIVKAIQKILE